VQIFSSYIRKCKQIAFKCTDFNASMRIAVYAECIWVNRLFEVFKHTKA